MKKKVTLDPCIYYMLLLSYWTFLYDTLQRRLLTGERRRGLVRGSTDWSSLSLFFFCDNHHFFLFKSKRKHEESWQSTQWGRKQAKGFILGIRKGVKGNHAMLCCLLPLSFFLSFCHRCMQQRMTSLCEEKKLFYFYPVPL